MAAQVIGNPDEIENFAKSLSLFNQQLTTMIGHLNAQFLALGDTWRDQEHRRFAEELQGTLIHLHRFSGLCEQHTPFLLRKASSLHLYLDQH